MFNIITLHIFFITGLFLGHAKAITVVFPANFPPWVVDEQRGVALDIVRGALQQAGYGFTPVFSPLPRLIWALRQPEVDAVAMVEEQALKQGFYSQPIVAFEAVVVSLRANHIILNSAVNLEYLVVKSFKGSTQIFPQLAVVEGNSNRFQELADQQGQVSMLFKRRADVIILDRSLFEYWAKQSTDEAFRQEVDIMPLNQIIPASHSNPVFVVFKQQLVRDKFNTALAEMRSSGRVEQIYAKYLLH